MLSRFLAPLSSPSRGLRTADPFIELHREMNRLFDDFLPGTAGTGEAQRALMAAPRIDVREGEQELSICAELPGVKPDEVDVRLDGDVLTIRGEKRNEAENKKEGYHVMERSFGQFQRSMQLPFTPDADQIRADFENGVLTVHVPKQMQQERSRRIEIQASGTQGPQPQQVSASTPSQESGQAGEGNVKH